MKVHLVTNVAKATSNPKFLDMLKELEQKGFIKNGYIDCDESQDEDVKKIFNSYGFKL